MSQQSHDSLLLTTESKLSAHIFLESDFERATPQPVVFERKYWLRSPPKMFILII